MENKQLELENFYLDKPEPLSGCLLALRSIILLQDADITNEMKYGMPFFCYRGKMFCYLWVHKTTHQPYLGIVEGKHFDEAEMVKEHRSRMKVMLFDAGADLPLNKIERILQKAIGLYKNGTILIKNTKS